MSAPPLRILLHSDVDVVRARQAALGVARRRGFSTRSEARVDLVVAELATNVIRHAGTGVLTIAGLDEPPGAIAVECIDRGPGMALPPVPSGKGLGLGLLSVRELSNTVEISSTPGHGTRVRVTVQR